MHHHSPSWYILSPAATAHISYDALIPAAMLTSLAICLVALRWYSRIKCRPGHVACEDWFISVAMILSLCFTALIGGEILLDRQNNDREDRKKANLSILLKMIFTQSLLYHLAIALVKSSFILQYTRLFSLVPFITRTCHILLVFILGAAAWGVFGVVFMCRPTRSYWDLGVPGSCLSAEDHFFSTSVLGIVVDWAIWILPIPVVGRLRLPRRQKMGLVGVFGLGGIVCIVSILRLVLVHHFAHLGRVTRAGTFAMIWSAIELNVAIICASLLVLKPLFARFIPAIVSEQPMSAREDARLWAGLGGLRHLADTEAAVEDEEEKEDDHGRRDTAVAMDEREMRRVALPARTWHPRRELKRRKSF
ncbi:hypothetical protein BDU57DRAFT_116496 [Ampelomyces quisqualis]|uniref:Rhodopsin domain-containing protein n=1 Tax=Ampelomyces quisqualis TaxID=50730 RepID=A0A6A5QVM4_AMPQU|nr:hypothetical protein BDU57DRAFT_116496 [Ampelomyces quisqualis]